jgi:hypothetical protein
MLPTTNILNQYHDAKRKINFEKITKMLEKNDEEQLGE